MSLGDIVLSVLLSIVASSIFWLLTFRISFTKILFSNNLVKSNYTIIYNRKQYGYRVRFINVGFRDLIEVMMVVKIVIKGDSRDHIIFPDISNSGKQNFITVLPGIVTKKLKKRSNMRTVTFYISESMQQELSKKEYPKKIRKLAKKRKLEFKDIFDEYGKNVIITVFVYGNDRVTGARKMFESKHYIMNDIEEGEFYGSKEIQISAFDHSKTIKEKISQVHKKILY